MKAATAKIIDAVQVKLVRDGASGPTVCHTCGSQDVGVREFSKPSPTKQWLVCRVCGHSRTVNTLKTP